MSIKHTITTELETNTEYRWKVRYKGANYGWSEWSDPTTFTTLDQLDYDSAANFTRSTQFLGAIGQDVIKVNDDMGVAPSDQSTNAEWGCYGTSMSGATSQTDGAANTSYILSNCAERPIAASVCANHGDGNWYLPAVYQLETLYSNRNNINSVADENFTSDVYWSSTEYYNINAPYIVTVCFYDGTTNCRSKDIISYVRCIRTF